MTKPRICKWHLIKSWTGAYFAVCAVTSEYILRKMYSFYVTDIQDEQVSFLSSISPHTDPSPWPLPILSFLLTKSVASYDY